MAEGKTNYPENNDEDYSMDSEDESFYYSSGEDASRGDDCDTNKKHYKILKEEDIRELQQNYISQVSSVLSVSKGLACTLLIRKNWNLTSVYDEWESEKTPEPVLITPETKSRKEACRICFEKTSEKNMVSAACGHPFCDGCWKVYITTSINDGPGCLTLICPDPDCKSAVGMDLIATLASEHMDKYNKYLARSYVECDSSRKWCPAPGCDFAIEFDVSECEKYDVTCDCSYKLCWNCAVESHRPVDCETSGEWRVKNTSEAENTMWILAHTKPCPKCSRPIDKNKGCNHMTCTTPCGFHFCWVCLGPWKDHANFYSCNRFKGKSVGTDDDARANAKKYMEIYTHYFERWETNDRSRKKALVDLEQARTERLDKIILLQGESYAQAKFVIEAWEQIVECRRVLKWSYAYGYFLALKDSKRKMEFFDHLQGRAESALEGLHHLAETEMDKYTHLRREDFKEFRKNLVDLTVVTKNYFQNFVTALENNLSEVEECPTLGKRNRD